MAQQVFHLNNLTNKTTLYIFSSLAGIAACIVNVITEPIIRYTFKAYIMGYPEQVAYLSAINCAISMAISAIPSVIVATFLYVLFRSTVLKNSKFI
jgi:hypothetical protein